MCLIHFRPAVNLTPTKASDNFPVAKVAELKKLKTVSNTERPVLGSEISNLGVGTCIEQVSNFRVGTVEMGLFEAVELGR